MGKLILSLLLFIGAPAFASFELRAHYGQMQGEPKDFNEAFENSFIGNPEIKSVSPIGGDLLYLMPGTPLGLGVRYETFDFKEDASVTAGGTTMPAETRLKGSRLSALAAFRLMRSPLGYVGFLGHYGIKTDMTYEHKSGPGGSYGDSKYTGKMDPTYGLGLEAGAEFRRFLIGAELGYTVLKAKSMEDSDGAAVEDAGGTAVPLDLSGTYFKLMVGLIF